MLSHRLSIPIIARDEEASLPGLFASLEGLVGRPDVQVLVVDTGSRDNTRDLAVSLGAELESFTWRDDFSAARNHALSLCDGDFILWLDADDALPPDTLGWVRRQLGCWDKDAAYVFKVLSPGPDGSASECSQIRLIPNHRRLRFRNPVHESLGDSVREAGLFAAIAPVSILHRGYRDAAVNVRKRRRNLALMEKALASPDPSPALLLSFARMCLAEERAADAEYALRRLLPDESASRDISLAARVNLGQCLMFQGRTREALDVFGECLDRGRGHAQYLLEYGKALWLQGRRDEARSAWKDCLAAGPSLTSVPTDWGCVLEGARTLLSQTC